MDMLVADGFYDKWRPVLNHKFTDYLHNVPLWESDSKYNETEGFSNFESYVFQSAVSERMDGDPPLDSHEYQARRSSTTAMD